MNVPIRPENRIMAKFNPQSEAALQKASAKYLALVLPKTFVPIHVPNEGRRGGRAGMLDGARQKAAGLVAGVPDWIILGPAWVPGPSSKVIGTAWAIELKAPGKYPSPEQKAFHARLAVCGVPVVVCRSLDEIEAALKTWGII